MVLKETGDFYPLLYQTNVDLRSFPHARNLRRGHPAIVPGECIDGTTDPWAIIEEVAGAAHTLANHYP